MKLSKEDIAYWDQAVELTSGGARGLKADESWFRTRQRGHRKTMITRTCRCCGNEFEITGDIAKKHPTSRCAFCRLSCNMRGPGCKP